MPTLSGTSKAELLASIERLTSKVIGTPWQDMAGAIQSVPAQDFTAEEWHKVVDFAALESALWQCEWLFSSQQAPDTNAKAEADGWGRLWDVFLKSLTDKVPRIEHLLVRKRNLVVAQLQIQRKLQAERGSQLVRFTSATLGGLAHTMYSVGLKSLAQGLLKRALYPAGSVGRMAG